MDFTKLLFRKAKEQDLAIIIAMLADDVLGKSRENPKTISTYQKVFLEISEDKNNFLAVVELEGEVIGTCHLTIMPSLTIQASKRMNIEAVRISNKFTNCGIGSWMIKRAIDFAKENNVKIIQLTTNKSRLAAHRFYEKCGFQDSHIGMKLVL